MSGCLADKVVIVTGAGSGIGRAIAMGCAAEGARIVIADIGAQLDGSGLDSGVAQIAADEIAAAGGQAIAASENVGRSEGADAIIEAALAEWGRIDGLVCCAGVLRHRPFLELTESDFDAVISSHLKGHFLMFQGVLTQMVKQGDGGSLIGISSGYVLGDPNRTPYRAAKAGIIALTKSVAMAGVEHDVRANVIAPIAETRMTRASQIPITAQPEDIAPAATYLLSDRAAAISGEVFSVSGNRIAIWKDPEERDSAENPHRWTLDEVDAAMAGLIGDDGWQSLPMPAVPAAAMPQGEPEV